MTLDKYPTYSVIPKAKMLEPAAMAMYCLPSKEYVMGEAFQDSFVLKLHNGFPVMASAAMSSPVSAAKMTSPVAVARVPPQDCAGPGCGSSQTTAPVRMFNAFRILSGFGSGDVFCDPPKKVLPGSQTPPSVFL